MFSFSLPSLNTEQDYGKVKSYLYQLTEQLRYVLNNIDTENLSSELREQYEGAVNISSSLAKLSDYVDGGLQTAEKNLGILKTSLANNEANLLSIYNELYKAISASANEVTKSYKSEIEQLNTSISSTLEEDYTLKTDTASLEAEFLSKWKQTARDMMAIFSSSYTGNTDISGLSDFAEQFNTYIRFSANGIEIGRDDNIIVARLQNNKLSFVQKGSVNEYEVAYISDKKLYITEANITNTLTLGAEAHGFLYDIKTDPEHGLTMTRRIV